MTSSSESMIQYRIHLILQNTFQFDWRRWGLYSTVGPVWLKKRYVKHMMNTPTWIHLQLIRNGTHNLHDFKWTNPFGEKLTTSFAVLYIKVLRTQKDLISNREHFLRTMLVCKRFLSLLSCNQTLACKGESRLPTLNESFRLWVHNFQFFTRWSPWVKTEVQEKRCLTYRRVKRCVMGKLCS